MNVQTKTAKEKKKEYNRKYIKQYYKDNVEYFEEYYIKNKEKRQLYNIKNKDKINLRRKNRYKMNKQFNARMKQSSMFRMALKKYIETGKYPICRNKNIDYKAIIDSLKPFKDTKIYDIDHIIPINSFDLTKDEHIKKAWCPLNIKWSLKVDNLNKCAKIDFNKYPEQKEVWDKLDLGGYKE